METILPQKCPQCGGEIRERKGTSKEGKSYHFWGCSNYPQCNYTWRSPSQSEKYHQEEMDALRKIYTKLEEIHKDYKAFTQIFSKK